MFLIVLMVDLPFVHHEQCNLVCFDFIYSIEQLEQSIFLGQCCVDSVEHLPAPVLSQQT